MKKPELIQKIAKDAGIKKTRAVRALDSLVSAIQETMSSGGKISLTGIGTFKVKARKAKKGRNPQTGETIMLPAGRKLSFKPSMSFKKLVKEV